MPKDIPKIKYVPSHNLADYFLPDSVPKAIISELKRHLANWTYLNAYLAQGTDVEEVGYFILLELAGKKRDFILSRLIGRLGSLIRDRLRSEIYAQLQGAKESPE